MIIQKISLQSVLYVLGLEDHACKCQYYRVPQGVYTYMYANGNTFKFAGR